MNRKQPAGRSGWPSPARERLIACATRCTASSWPNTTRSSDLLERPQPLAIRRGRLPRRNARHARDDALDLAGADVERRPAISPAGRGRRGVSRMPAPASSMQIDRAVGQPVVAQMPRRRASRPPRARRRCSARGDAPRSGSQARENLHGLVDRRLVDGDLLQPPRERAILLDVLELLEASSSRSRAARRP